MREVFQISPLIILGVLCLFLAIGRVRFGYGLADIIYYGLGYLGLIIYGIYFLWAKKSKPQKKGLIFPFLSIVFCSYLLLSMTFWRGPAYSWNGLILVPRVKKKDKNPKKILNVTIELIPERENIYYVTWEDTIGMKSKYGILNRPLELWCHVQNTSLDTIGYYRGLSTPSTFTYFDTKDSIITIEFSKAFNFFNEAFENEVERKAFWEKNKIPVRFAPIVVNLNKDLKQKLMFELKEK